MNRAAIIIAAVHFVISLFTDRLIFQYAVFDTSSFKQMIRSAETVLVKICFLILLVILWQWLFRFFENRKKMFNKVALGYFLLNLILLLFIWPGIWRMDEFGILSSAVRLFPSFWQNYITSVFYILALMLLPFPAGIVIVQIAVVSLFASQTFCNILKIFELKKNSVDNLVSNTAAINGKTGIDSIGQQHEGKGKNAGLPFRFAGFLLIPLVMFPVLDSNLYPMRMSVWAFLELTILSQALVMLIKAKTPDFKDNTANNASLPAKSMTGSDFELSDNFSTTGVSICGKEGHEMVLMCVSAAIMTVWRTEAVYYVLFFPLLLISIFRSRLKYGSFYKTRKNENADGSIDEETGQGSGEGKASDRIRINNTDIENDAGKTSIRQASRSEKRDASAPILRSGNAIIKYLLIYFVAFLILFIPQKIGEKYESGQQYELTGMVLPLTKLVEAAYDNNSDEDRLLLESVDKVINVDITVKGLREGKNGINLFWSEPLFQRDYTPQDFSECSSAYHKLIFRYPMVFISERLETFLESNDLLMDTTKLFSDMDNPNHVTFAGYPLAGPLSEKLRNTVISILELRKTGDYDEKMPGADAVYSPILSMIILLASGVYLLIKRRWGVLIVILCAIVKVPLIFLTAPSRLFMYYYPAYLEGMVLLFAFIAYKTGRNK